VDAPWGESPPPAADAAVGALLSRLRRSLPPACLIRGETDEELLANAREHIRTSHPEMAGTVTDADLLAMATEG
jgi:hypothetical protein